MRRLLLFALLCTSSGASGADLPGSLREERELFPDVLEAITGKFEHRSTAFQEWLIKDRQAKLTAAGQNPAIHDELAFAHAQSGNLDKAIETMSKVGNAPPDRYETHANLALFHFLKSEFELSLGHLDKARSIRPNEVAGRDQCLQWLVEYRLEKPTRRSPIAPIEVNSESPRPRSFAIFLSTKLKKSDLDLADAQAIARGMVEIMRIGNRESTFLLEALGDVLVYSSALSKSVAPRLAARAYLRAGYLVPQPGLRKAYITLAEWSLTFRVGSSEGLDNAKEAMPVLTRLFAELEDAKAWSEAQQTREKELLASSSDPEGDIRRLYAEPPRVPDDPNDPALGSRPDKVVMLAAGAGVLLVVGYFVVRKRRMVTPPNAPSGSQEPSNT